MKSIYLLTLTLFLNNCKDTIPVNEFYSLDGKVISSHTGNGLPNAKILVNKISVDTTDSEGRYQIPRLRNQNYSFQILPPRHYLPLVIDSLKIPSEDSYFNFSLDLKYNLINNIHSSFGVVYPNNLIGSYLISSNLIIIEHKLSTLKFEFDRFITNEDTLEFAFSHNSGEAHFFQFLRFSFNTEEDAIISLIKSNDGQIRTSKFLPPFSERDSTKQ